MLYYPPYLTPARSNAVPPYPSRPSPKFSGSAPLTVHLLIVSKEGSKTLAYK